MRQSPCGVSANNLCPSRGHRMGQTLPPSRLPPFPLPLPRWGRGRGLPCDDADPLPPSAVQPLCRCAKQASYRRAIPALPRLFLREGRRRSSRLITALPTVSTFGHPAHSVKRALLYRTIPCPALSPAGVAMRQPACGGAIGGSPVQPLNCPGAAWGGSILHTAPVPLCPSPRGVSGAAVAL